MSTSPSQQNQPVAPRRRRVVAAAVAAVLAVGGLAFFTAQAELRRTAAQQSVIQQRLDMLVGDDRPPGALAAVRDRTGKTRHYTAGVGNLETGANVPTNGRVRIASISKTFAAVVVLQLVEEGAVDLDASIETYLPGLVRSEGTDPAEITVRQLLQHTSGLPNYSEVLLPAVDDVIPNRHVYLEPRELLDLANSRRGEPAGDWSYSNTNYLLAGLLAQRVTGRPFNELITTRIIQPLKLHDTYAPGVGEEEIRGRHPRGYQRDYALNQLIDFTQLDPSSLWGAGHLISTPDDVNTFLRALLDGELLKPAQLAEMRTTVAPDPEWGQGYGLGILTAPLSCGGVVWGHGGEVAGYSTLALATDDGRAVTVAVTTNTMSIRDSSFDADRAALVGAALCGEERPDSASGRGVPAPHEAVTAQPGPARRARSGAAPATAPRQHPYRR